MAAQVPERRVWLPFLRNRATFSGAILLPGPFLKACTLVACGGRVKAHWAFSVIRSFGSCRDRAMAANLQQDRGSQKEGCPQQLFDCVFGAVGIIQFCL
ncbi:hypothetical protein D9M71_209210 [compost metagenome]